MIESYEFGEIVVGGKTYTSDLIIFSDRIDARWWRKSGHELCLEDIGEIIEENPDILVVGTGHSGLMKVLPQTKSYLESKGIELIAEKTEKACQLYNQILSSTTKKVIAAFHLTC